MILGKIFKYEKISKIGENLFFIGIFLLASAPFISIIFILFSFILNKKNNFQNLVKDRWNIPLFITSFLMIISSLIHIKSAKNIYNWEYSLSWIGLFNWIPLFWCFWESQCYLENIEKRKLCAYCFISGTIPVIISGIGQYYFGWVEPLELFNGLIIWFQKPILDPAGLSGLFSNANYAGAWLNIVWPFTIAAIMQKNNLLKKTTIIAILFGFLTCLILTNSRAAWGGMFISIIIIFGIKSIRLIFPTFILIGTIIYACIKPIFGESIQIIFRSFIPEKLWMEFTSAGFDGLDTSRISIWESGLKYIKENLIFGSGAGSFTSKFFSETGFYKGHSHNIVLELAISYGLPVAILIFLFIFLLLYFSIFKTKLFFNFDRNNKEYFDIAWVASTFAIIISNMVDVQYFDIRISISFWILLSGIKNMITHSEN